MGMDFAAIRRIGACASQEALQRVVRFSEAVNKQPTDCRRGQGVATQAIQKLGKWIHRQQQQEEEEEGKKLTRPRRSEGRWKASPRRRDDSETATGASVGVRVDAAERPSA